MARHGSSSMPRVLCFAGGATGWCWRNTARELKAALSGRVHVDILSAGRRVSKDAGEEYDLFWHRGYPYNRPAKVFKTGVPYVWQFTTGGQRTEALLEKCRAHLTMDCSLRGRGVRGVIAQNLHVLNKLRGLGARAVIIPNGVNTTLFRPTGERYGMPVTRALMAANLTGSRGDLKGFPPSAEACRALGVELRTVSYGQTQVPNYQMPGVYNSVDVLLQPSHSEGCSNTVMEAMACGLPCVLVRGVGYHGEVCEDARESMRGNVLFVEGQNASEIAAAIDRLRTDAALRKRLVTNARLFAEQHAWSRIALMYETVFRNAIKSVCTPLLSGCPLITNDLVRVDGEGGAHGVQARSVADAGA